MLHGKLYFGMWNCYEQTILWGALSTSFLRYFPIAWNYNADFLFFYFGLCQKMLLNLHKTFLYINILQEDIKDKISRRKFEPMQMKDMSEDTCKEVYNAKQ